MIPNCDSMVDLSKYVHSRQRYPTPELMFTQSASTARYQIHGWKLAWPYLEHCRLNTSARSSVVKCKGRAYRHIVHVFNRYPQTQVPREHKPSPQRRLCVLDPIALHSSRLSSSWRAQKTCLSGEAWSAHEVERAYFSHRWSIWWR